MKELETVTNNLLDAVRDIEFCIQLFALKTNPTNALKIRNKLKYCNKIFSDFNKTSIESFKK